MERVGIIGTGNMGESILKALLKNSVEKNNLCFIEAKKERALYIADTYGIDEAREMTELAKRSDIVVLAVKPQDAAKILPQVASSMTGSHILISIMAGITISQDRFPRGHIDEDCKDDAQYCYQGKPECYWNDGKRRYFCR